MKKRNKLVAVLLSCCMAVALFAGCGNNDKGTAENDNNQGVQGTIHSNFPKCFFT